MGSNQQFSLRWNNYINHITGAFDSLRSDEDLVDVTLSCEGKRIRAHKMLLSACSTYFRDLFKENPCPHPVIIFRNVKFEDLVALIDFMYQGEVNVVQDQLASFLTTAELLAVQGLSEGGYKDSSSREDDLANSPALPPEPEIQMTSSNHSQQESCSSAPSVSSPVSFLTLDHEPESPCAKRRKKSSSNVIKSNSTNDANTKLSEREKDTDRNFISTQSNGDADAMSSEIIPVISNLKVEMPDYVQHDLSSTYDDSDRSVNNVTVGQDVKTDRLSLSHNTHKREPADDQSIEPPDMFCPNSRESSLPSIPESLSTSDLSQVLSKPGTSSERQTQDSTQGDPELTAGKIWFTQPSSSEFFPSHHEKKYDYKEAQFVCRICGKGFRSQNSCYDHMAIHRGTSKCSICECVLSRKANMKRHMRFVHGVSDC